jgi:Na+/proline symporter
VQRYLTTKSVKEAQVSLLMSAYWKIPLQALVLLVGVLLFLFYTFTPTPMLFNTIHERELRQGPKAQEYATLERRFEGATAARSAAATVAARADAGGHDADRTAAQQQFLAADTEVKAIRTEALALVRSTTGDQAYSDVNYVFPTFITTQLPIGVTGLLIAAIFAAAMSAISAELTSLSTATVMDFYRRFLRPGGDDASVLRVSRFATAFWAIFASAIAVWAAELGSLIEVVNRFGSFFYGSILGVFILAIGWKRATPNGAFVGLIAGMGSVAWFATYTKVAFLWHNLIGAVGVVVAGILVSAIERAVRGKPVEGGV